MSDVYDIWLYPLQDWWRTVNEMSDFMSTGQMENFIYRSVTYVQCSTVCTNRSVLYRASSTVCLKKDLQDRNITIV